MTAHLSADRVYRYWLTRGVSPLIGKGEVAFIGLNPSIADESRDDPTIRRCIGFARTWGYSDLHMLNLYAYRATDPRWLDRVDDPVGPDNDRYIRNVLERCSLVICAWGNRGHGDRARAVLELIDYPRCLAVTKIGAPQHPLYVRADTTPIPYALSPSDPPTKLTR